MSEQSEERRKIVLLGDKGVGKTCLLRRYVDEFFTMDSQSTIGAYFASKPDLKIGERLITLHAWDVSGSELDGNLNRLYLRNSSAVLIAFDLSRESTLLTAEQWIRKAKNSLEDTPMLLVGCKEDLTPADNIDEKASKLAEEYNMPYMKTSSKDDSHVTKLFNKAAKLALKHVPETPVKTKEDDAAKKALQAIQDKIMDELNNADADPSFKIGFFGSRQMTNKDNVKIRVHTNVKEIISLTVQGLYPIRFRLMTAKEACNKIRTIIDDKELRNKKQRVG